MTPQPHPTAEAESRVRAWLEHYCSYTGGDKLMGTEWFTFRPAAPIEDLATVLAELERLRGERLRFVEAVKEAARMIRRSWWGETPRGYAVLSELDMVAMVLEQRLAAEEERHDPAP